MSLTSFVGRQRELDELRSLLRDGKRLVTLVGTGGIGKTRLALEVGWSTGHRGWTNVYVAELASLTPDLVDNAVLESVGGGSSSSPLEAAVECLRGTPALLVLDCCEHVLGAVRQVAEVLLRRCPSVVILATSRSPIGIAGELVWAVPPLSVRDAGETELSDAARLFTDRASDVQSRFELSGDAARAVETIVRRVGGIPLAIELAAARVRVLSPEEIVAGLDDHLRMLRGGHRSDPRHRAIRASLDWSHELLTGRERRLFARLSVFSGSFGLEAAAAVCAGDGMVPGQVLDEIQGLVDKSLLSVERRAGATRFRMLDFVRQYAAERLAAERLEDGGEGNMADRHRVYFRELAERADRELWALNPAGRARLDDESPNLRAAIDSGCDRAPGDALAIAGALGLYWRVRGRLAEGVTATEQSLRAAPSEPSSAQALALGKLSVLSFWVGEFGRTRSAATAAAAMGAAVGDTRSQALALSRLGALIILTDPAAGDPMLRQAAELARAAGDQVALCDALGSLAISYFCQDNPGAMRGPLEETLRVAEAIGYEDDIRWCLWCLAHTALWAGDLAGARAHAERALVTMPGQDPLSGYHATEVLSLLDAYTGAADTARERAEASLEQSRQEKLRLGTGVLMHALSVAALAAGDLDRAAQRAAELYERRSAIRYVAWHAQEILVAVALAREDTAAAKTHVERLLAAAGPLKNRRAQAVAHLGLARALLLEGDDQRAESIAHDALKVLMEHGWRPSAFDALDILAGIAAYRREHERAVRLAAAAQQQRRVLGLVAFPHARERAERQLAAAGAELGEEKFEKAKEEGTRLSLDEAVAYAQRGRGEHTSATYGWASLSPVERQVVELASRGRSNPDIARELFMARNTVKVHLSRVYAKLGVANRTELARLAARRP